LPPLHVKLGLMKQFVKASDKSGGCSNTCGFFPELSLEKRKAEIFDGPIFVGSSTTQILQEKRLTLSFLHGAA